MKIINEETKTITTITVEMSEQEAAAVYHVLYRGLGNGSLRHLGLKDMMSELAKYDRGNGDNYFTEIAQVRDGKF